MGRIFVLLLSIFAFPAFGQEFEHKPVQGPAGGTPVKARNSKGSPWGFNNDWLTVNSEDSLRDPKPEQWTTLGTEAYRKAKDAGIGFQRFVIGWDNMQSSGPDQEPIWNAADGVIEQAKENGIDTYIGFASAPAWATGGQGWYTVNACFFWEFNPLVQQMITGFPFQSPEWATAYTKMHADGTYATKLAELTAKYAPTPWDKPWGFLWDVAPCSVAKNYPVNSDLLKGFIGKLVNHYPAVRYWGFGNETRQWPAGWDTTTDQNAKMAIDWLLVPGYEAVKAIDPRLMVVGPESDGEPTYLESILRQEDNFIKGGGHPFFDVISLHLYAALNPLPASQQRYGHPEDALGYPDNAWYVFQHQIAPLLDKYGRGRPVWLTEFGLGTHLYPDDLAKSDQVQADGLGAMIALAWTEMGVKHANWRLEKAFVYRLADGRSPATPDVDWAGGCAIIYSDYPGYSPRPAWYKFEDFCPSRQTLPPAQ